MGATFLQALMDHAAVGKPVIVTETGIPDHDDSRRELWATSYLRAVIFPASGLQSRPPVGGCLTLERDVCTTTSCHSLGVTKVVWSAAGGCGGRWRRHPRPHVCNVLHPEFHVLLCNS